MVNAKWILEPWRLGLMPIAAMKAWMELVGMVGGPVRAPCAEMTEADKKAMKADLEGTGLLAKAKALIGDDRANDLWAMTNALEQVSASDLAAKLQG